MPVPRRGLLTVALLLAIALTALEGTVVLTAMPTILGELRGLALYPWVSSAYLLALTVSVPIYGNLADLYGRRRVLLAALGLFLLGSALSGVAISMTQLVAFRALQGLGAGGVQPLAQTIVGDTFRIPERARIQPLFSAVWGAAALGGPLLGAALTQHLSWRWVFYVNLPIGLLVAGIAWSTLVERVERRRAPFDVPGALLLAGTTSALLMTMLQGRALGWRSPAFLLLMAASLGSFAAFLWVERRAAAPLIPLGLFANPTIAVSVSGSLLLGAVFFAVETYVPLYVQGALGGDAIDAGTALAPLLVCWTLSAAIGIRAVVRFGFLPTALTATALLLLGVTLLVLVTRGGGHPGGLHLATALIGLGLGSCLSAYVVVAQHEAGWSRRGITTSLVHLARSLGGALGVAALGAWFTTRLLGELERMVAGDEAARSAALLLDRGGHGLPAPVAAAGRAALAHALGDLYLALVLVCAAALVNAWIVAGRRRRLRAP
jgi:EmrB/QacA subfamily drug resistance transporter